MSIVTTSLAAFDGRPYFNKALRYGIEGEIITPGRLENLQEDFAKGIDLESNIDILEHRLE